MKITKINQRTIDKLFNSTKQCVECNYYDGYRCCLSRYKVYCAHNEFWTPKGYIRGLRIHLDVMDDYCGLSNEVINYALKPFVIAETESVKMDTENL